MALPIASIPFRFDKATHTYIDLANGEVRPHVTGLLEAAGIVDDLWLTEESAMRGTAVHELTADYDLGALDVASCKTPYRGWLLSHVKAMEVIPHVFTSIEEPLMHPTLRFGGRPDRLGTLWRRHSVLDGKSGPPAKSHEIQTALQAILVAPRLNLLPEQIDRFALYWSESGKYKLLEHKNLGDFREARKILREHL